MNALALELLSVAKEYLGPAAPAFLSREFTALGVSGNTIEDAHVLPLAERARRAAARVMDTRRATQFAQALAERGGSVGQDPTEADHRLAINAAAKLFASGRLRQAEAAFRQLVAKHGDVASYAGLARTLISLEDVEAALAALREGASAYARKSDRVHAIALLGLAVDIAPSDLAAHRRLAAALANQGDLIGACQEYARFIDAALALRDTRRAWLELSYGRETLGDLPQLLALADRVAAAQGGVKAATPPAAPISPMPPVIPSGRPTIIGLGEWTGPKIEPRQPAGPPANAAPPVVPAPAQARTRPEASTAVVMKDARTLTHVEQTDVINAAALLARAGLNGRPKADAVAASQRPARPPIDLDAELARLAPRGNTVDDAAVADLRATLLIGARDARATEAALDAARKHLALRKLQAASDVLLSYIGAGFRDREAQRLLIEINCELGRRDVAREKCQLLGAAYRLDGQGSVAEDVERLARFL
jgi:hypothetical protein